MGEPNEWQSPVWLVSMKSGLEGRNNRLLDLFLPLNQAVSMKSGLEGRNNQPFSLHDNAANKCLNEVRPRRPEQLSVPAIVAMVNALSQ